MESKIILNTNALSLYLEVYMNVNNLSMRALASKVGVSVATISRICKGMPPDVNTFLALFLVLGIKDIRKFATIQ